MKKKTNEHTFLKMILNLIMEKIKGLGYKNRQHIGDFV